MKKFLKMACSVVLLFAGAGPGRAAANMQKAIDVIFGPAGNAPVIDGKIMAEEWRGARSEFFSDGSELLLLRHGDDLYLGIRAQTQDLIAGNVFIEAGDGVTIHHASMALGTAEYRKNGEDWRLVRDFSWRCRGTGDVEKATAERETFLREEKWIASTSGMGNPQELEYRIQTPHAPFRLAVNFLRASAPQVKIPWPASLDGDCLKPTPGGLPPVMRFSPDQWTAVSGLSGSTAESEKVAIVQTALDYGDGFYSGEADRMERAIHPDLNKVYVRFLPQTKTFLVGYSTFSGLIELTRSKAGLTEPAARKIKAEVLLVNEDVACAKMTSAQFNDFLQMAKIEGRWKIVNVLWVPGPDSQGRRALAGFDPAQESDRAKKAVLDFVEGSFSGDAAKVESVLHPEACRAVFQVSPQTGKAMISRSRFSGLVESVRAKMGIVPEDQRQVDIRVIDILDGMAFVESSSRFSYGYYQLFWFDGQWRILNILTKSKARS
jgi:hypothetical protein